MVHNPLTSEKNTNILIPILLSSFTSEGPCPLRLLTSPFQLHILTWREVTYYLFFPLWSCFWRSFCKFCWVRGIDLRDRLKLELCLELFFSLKCSPPSFGGKKYFKPCFLWYLYSSKIISSDYAASYLATLWVTEPVLIILCPSMSPCVGEVRKVKSGV